MALFYTELKSLRESQDIALEELASRTKINIQYLEAIEMGKFDVLELPYIRLFLRAYVVEIGGDATRALEQLDSLSEPTKLKRPEPPKDELQNKTSSPSSINSSKNEVSLFLSDLKLRQDLIKGSVLLLIFIFAIVIFRQIFNEENLTEPNRQEIQTPSTLTVSEDSILSQFHAISTSNAIIATEPPFFLVIQSREQIEVIFSLDQGESQTINIRTNENKTFPPFIESANILLPNTHNITAMINGESPGKIEQQNSPVRLEVSSSPPSVKITHYAPNF